MIMCSCKGISDHQIGAAAGWMRSADPHTVKTLFGELIADAGGDTDFPDTRIGLCDCLGAEKLGQLNAKPADRAE